MLEGKVHPRHKA